MTITEYKSKRHGTLKQSNLVFLRRDDELLLAMKKRGFGVGRWNGAGGKVEAGESVEEAAIRETREEIGVEVKKLTEMAKLRFYFAAGAEDSFQSVECTVYICEKWDGEPSESEEMAPAWYKLSEIPYDGMWPEDRRWLPQVLDGKYVEAESLFGDDNTLIEMSVMAF